MSWLSEFFKKRIEMPDFLCISCRKPVEFPEHVEKWQRNSWAATAICDDCQMSHWQRKIAEDDRKEQEYIDRIADAVAKKMRE